MSNPTKPLARTGVTVLLSAVLALVAAPASAEPFVPTTMSVDAVSAGSPLGWAILIGGAIVLVAIQVMLSRSTRRSRRKSSD